MSREFHNVRVSKVIQGKKGPFAPECRNDAGQTFFIDNRLYDTARLQQGMTIPCVQAVVQKPNPNGRPSADYYVLDVPLRPQVEWAKWQTEGPDGKGLYETKAGDAVGLSFGCFGCGQQIVAPEDVLKIKGGCVWTWGEPEALEPYGRPIYNRAKDVDCLQAACTKCGANMGTYYPQPYADDEDNKPFPCYKLTFQRGSKNDPEYVAQHLVLLGDEDEVTQEMRRLAEGGAPVRSTRVDADTHEVAKQLRAMAFGDKE